MVDAPPPGYEEFAAETEPTPELPTERAPAADALAAPIQAPAGYDEFIAPEMKEEKYGTPLEMGKTALEGIGKGLAGPLFTGAETSLLGNEKEQLARQEVNPGVHGLGEVTGLVSGSLAAPEITLGGALGKLGAGAEGIAAATGLGKLGSSVVKGIAENAAFQLGDEASKMILKDPAQSADTAIADMGLAALVGGGFGTISPLWHATMGKKMGGVLGAIVDKAGGIEGQSVSDGAKALSRSGMDIAPELYGMVAEEPAVQEMARTLNQSDSSKAGRSFQESYKNMTKQAGDSLVGALGKSAEEVAAMPEVSAYESGKKLANTLADEYEAHMNPFATGFDEVKSGMQHVELTPTLAAKAEEIGATQTKLQDQLDKAIKIADKVKESGSPEELVQASAKVQELTNAIEAAKTAAATPGTVDTILDNISKRAIQEGWVTSPSSDIMKEVRRIQKELPLQKNLKNLSDYISQVGNNTSKDLMNGPLKRAGAIMTSIMKDAEGELMATHIGSEAGPDAVQHLRALQEGYKVQSALKEAIQDRLGAKGSTGGYAKAIREMSSTDAEGVLRRLSGKSDADWLDFVQKHYPNTAEVLRNYHKDALLESAVNKAKEGMTIDNTALINKIKAMPKELRDFVVPPQAQQQISNIGTALEAFKNANHNFSNTARVGSSLLKDASAGAASLIMYATGHGFAASALAGLLSKTIGKEAPDAVRLGILKFLGSSNKLDPGAFKTMVDYIQHTVKGETLLSNATKNLFRAGSEVIPARLMPKESDRKKITEAVDDLDKDPQKMLDVTGKTGHYMPDQAEALGGIAGNAVQFLKTQKPNTSKASPLDTQREVNPTEKAKYNRILDIAQQPLIILKHISEGKLTPSDVMVQKTLYPALYQRTVNKLTDQIAEAGAKDRPIPYKTRMGLSLYMGQPMDSTMTPNNIMAAQPQPQNNQQATPSQPASNPKHSTSSLNKISKMYKTQAQSAEQDRTQRD